MLTATFHREDIKAVLRKRHGSVQAFATKRNLKPQAIADWLRGRTNAQVAKAIETELRAAGGHKSGQSIKLDNSADDLTVHRLNADGRAASVAARWQKAVKDEAADANDTMSFAYGWSDEVADQIGLNKRTVERDIMLYRRLAPSVVERLRAARHPGL